MSTYEHIQPNTAYPALLLYHGYNDPRVDVWESAKAAARFQADTTSGKPVLLDIDYALRRRAWHWKYPGTDHSTIQRAADILAFMLWNFGDPDFQPSKPRISKVGSSAKGRRAAKKARKKPQISRNFFSRACQETTDPALFVDSSTGFHV